MFSGITILIVLGVLWLFSYIKKVVDPARGSWELTDMEV